MNKQQIISAVQSMIDQGRQVISVRHEIVAEFKRIKKEADECGALEAEYIYHNLKEKEREALRTAVRNQKALKIILKELQNSDVSF
jgi:uncharacterized NAD-dependent epimerase/dehydratase family protein